MYFRQKKSGNHTYLQIVQSHRQEGQPRQRVIATLGRLDQDNKRFLLRSQTTGVCSKVFQAVGVALPPTVRSASAREITSA